MGALVRNHTKVRGYHPLVAVVAGTGDVVHSRQRGGNANSGRGAGSFLRLVSQMPRPIGTNARLVSEELGSQPDGGVQVAPLSGAGPGSRSV